MSTMLRLGGLAAALALAGCGRQAALPAQARQATAVTTEAARRDPVERRVTATGTVQPWQEVVLSVQTGGLAVTEVRVSENDSVRAGDVLARLDDRSLKAQVAQQRAAVAEARANLDSARTESTRADGLLAQRAMSAETAEARRTTVRTGQAKLDAAEAALAVLAVTLEQTTVRSPVDGTVSQAPVRVGSVPQVGGEVARVVRDGRHEVQVKVPERLLSSVRPGMAVRVTASDGSAVDATVRDVAAKVDPASRLGVAYVSLPAGSRLRDGESARAEVVTGSEIATTVPERSLVWEGGTTRAFVVGPNGTARSRSVETGQRRDGRVAVTAGLTAGDAVVVDGAGFLHDGEEVVAVPPVGAVREASR